VRIAYLANARIPSRTANSMQVMKMCAALSAAGNDLTLIVPRFVRLLPTRSVLSDHYGVDLDFEIQWLRGWRTQGRMMVEARAVLRALGLRADLNFTRNVRIAAALAGARRPTMYEAHEPPRGIIEQRAFRVLLRGPGLRRLIFVSDGLRRIFETDYPSLRDDPRVTVESGGVDLERFEHTRDMASARQELRWDPVRFTAGYAGHLYSGRGFDVILGLAEHFPEVAFKVAGGEPAAVEAAALEVTARGLKNVDLVGFVPNAQIPRFLAGCDTLLAPYGKTITASGGTETSTYCSPLKLFEYMAAGRLLLVSALPTLLEVLNERNARLCRPDDLPDWICAMQEAIADPGVRALRAAQARQDVQSRAWSARVRRLLEVVPAGGWH
jgi:glycosyltransferase involved in cell wall biosynthesis